MLSDLFSILKGGSPIRYIHYLFLVILASIFWIILYFHLNWFVISIWIILIGIYFILKLFKVNVAYLIGIFIILYSGFLLAVVYSLNKVIIKFNLNVPLEILYYLYIIIFILGTIFLADLSNKILEYPYKVILENGEVLDGKSIREDDKYLILETDFKEIKIRKDKIVYITSKK